MGLLRLAEAQWRAPGKIRLGPAAAPAQRPCWVQMSRPEEQRRVYPASYHPDSLSGRVKRTSDRVVVPDPGLGSSARADARGNRYRAPPVWRVPLRRIERRCCFSLPFG